MRIQKICCWDELQRKLANQCVGQKHAANRWLLSVMAVAKFNTSLLVELVLAKSLPTNYTLFKIRARGLMLVQSLPRL